jgi:hypothetical protein
LPQRVRPPLLPPLGALVHSDPLWAFRGTDPAGDGLARLRVWQAGTVSYLAVVTESGQGLPAAGALEPVWGAVASVWMPVQLLLHSPGRLDPHGRDSADLVAVPPALRGEWRTVGVHPAAPEYAEFCDSWWERFGPQITAG